MMRTFSTVRRSPRPLRASSSATACADVDPAVVKGAPADDARDDAVARRLHRREVGERGDAAGQDDRDRHGARQLDGRLDVRAGEHAVAADIGEDDRRHAGILEPPGEVEGRDVRLLRPPLHRDAAVARVDADGDAAGKVAARGANQIRAANSRRSEDDPAYATLQPVGGRRQRADAAAELHRQVDGIEDRVDRVAVDGTAGEGAVEVDDMQPAAAGVPRRRAPGPRDAR